MGVILEIRSGAAAGKAIALRRGESVTVGRAAGKSKFPLAHDTFMSGLHFAVECSASGCRVVDRKSSNGTFLNGAKIQDAMLANGDEVKAGQTVFHVKIVADEKIPATTSPQQPIAPPVSRPPHAEPPPQPPRDAAPSAGARVSEPPPRIAEPAALERVPQAALPQPAVELPRKPVDEPLSWDEPVAPREERGASDEAANAAEWRGEPAKAPSAARPAPVADRPIERSGSSRAGERSSALSVAGWQFPAAPADWEVVEGFGLQHAGEREFPSSVSATEEALAGITLQQFVESQISMLRGYLRDPKIDPTIPPRIAGADEAMSVDVRHITKDGTELAYRHIYARSGSSVGILTVTTLASEFPQVLASLQSVLEGAAFRATVHAS